MSRVIDLRYAGTCVDCGARLPRGVRARWMSRGRIMCLACYPERTTRDGQEPHVSNFTTSGGTFTRCNCEDYPCCGH